MRRERTDTPVSDPRSLGVDQPGGTDVLSDVLRAVRLTGSLFFRLDVSSPWVDEIPRATEFAPVLMPGAQHVVSYHIVRRGGCWAALSGAAPARLEAGDILVIPHGDAYTMASAPGLRSNLPRNAMLEFFREMAKPSAPAAVAEGGGEAPRAEVICGFLGWDHRPFNPLLESLPRLVHLRPKRGAKKDRVGQLVDLALAELLERRPGSRCVLLQLSELLFVEVVRRHLASSTLEDGGWFSALGDPIAGRALSLLHAAPADEWSLERLARAIGVSRSLLAERFTALVGQPPMRYLARWRMQLACGILRDNDAKISAVAQDVGYQSEAAFSRAFKAMLGTAPATWRARSQKNSRTRPA